MLDEREGVLFAVKQCFTANIVSRTECLPANIENGARGDRNAAKEEIIRQKCTTCRIAYGFPVKLEEMFHVKHCLHKLFAGKQCFTSNIACAIKKRDKVFAGKHFFRPKCKKCRFNQPIDFWRKREKKTPKNVSQNVSRYQNKSIG